MGRLRNAALGLTVLALVASACGDAPAPVAVGDGGDGVRFPVDISSGDAEEPSYTTADVPSARSRPRSGVKPAIFDEVVPGRRRATAGICGEANRISTGPVVDFPWAPPCVTRAMAPAGSTARGVNQTTIRVAYYISGDPKIMQASRNADGCGTAECWKRYVRAYAAWFNRYFELYGRQVSVEMFDGSPSESDVNMARADADKLADAGYFAVLNGPGEAGASFAERLASRGVLCVCTISLPEDFYRRTAPYVWGWLMSSTQAYLHRADYVGRRLAGRKAIWAGTPALRAQERRFGLVWFNNHGGDYESGVDFFVDRLRSYGVEIDTTIEYLNIEGCQSRAASIAQNLKSYGVTTVIFAGDPLCPVQLTRAAQAAGAAWEWFMTGSAYTDLNGFARLYDQTQWARAFGVSMNTPDVAVDKEYWARMLSESDPGIVPMEDAGTVLHPLIPFFTGAHMAGPVLNAQTFEKGMHALPSTGGTVTIPVRSYGPRLVSDVRMTDHTSFDDMTEVWWDADAVDMNGRRGAYRYVGRGARYRWDQWPSSTPEVFRRANSILGYADPPDQ